MKRNSIYGLQAHYRIYSKNYSLLTIALNASMYYLPQVNYFTLCYYKFPEAVLCSLLVSYFLGPVNLVCILDILDWAIA